MIVLATDYLYVKAEKVHSISVQEHVQTYTRSLMQPVKSNSPTLAKDDSPDMMKEKIFKTTYTISIHYVPTDNAMPGAYTCADIKINNKDECHRLMRTLVTQLKEQDPDLVDRIFEDQIFKKEKEDDRRAKKIRGARKEKRRS
jgi:hypothetical protein